MSHDWSPLPIHTFKELDRWLDWAEHHAEHCVQRATNTEIANVSQWRWAIKDLVAAQQEIRTEVIKKT
jgi:hypothetical protein